MADDEAAPIAIDIERSESEATVIVRGEIDLETSAALIDALAADPARRDLAWRLGLDAELIDRTKRTTELRNFLEHLVAPTRAARGRG